MSYEEIDDTTPLELEALTEHYLDELDIDNQRFGLICSTLCNLKRDPDQKPEPYQPSDFFRMHREQESFNIETSEQDHTTEMLDDFWVCIKTRTRMKQGKK